MHGAAGFQTVEVDAGGETARIPGNGMPGVSQSDPLQRCWLSSPVFGASLTIDFTLVCIANSD